MFFEEIFVNEANYVAIVVSFSASFSLVICAL